MTGTIINIITVLIGGSAGSAFWLAPARAPEKHRHRGHGSLHCCHRHPDVPQDRKPAHRTGRTADWRTAGRMVEDRRRVAKPGTHASKNASHPPPKLLPIVKLLQNDFVRGFLTASLLFCVGPIAILGSIQDGLTGNYELLAVKSVLDGFASLAFASTLGVGVLFSTWSSWSSRAASACWPCN